MAILRFLVAMGVGGEWAVAASLVAEVFPARARARAGGIFHATSVAGTWLASTMTACAGPSFHSPDPAKVTRANAALSGASADALLYLGPAATLTTRSRRPSSLRS